MLAFATAALLLAGAPETDRFASTSLEESQRRVLQAWNTGLESVNGYYHWATHSVVLDRYIAQQKAVQVGKDLEAARAAFTEMAGMLTPSARATVTGEVTTVNDALAKADAQLSKLRMESGAASPSRTEARFLTAELYRSLSTIHQAQLAIGQKLGLAPEERTRERAR